MSTVAFVVVALIAATLAAYSLVLRVHAATADRRRPRAGSVARRDSIPGPSAAPSAARAPCCGRS